jgi:hypothetical protein
MQLKPKNEAPVLLIQETAKLLHALPEQTARNRRSFLRVIRDIWIAVKGYTADDINRLKEGGVQQVEGRGQTAIAEAKAKTAEAAERHAKAELNLAEAQKAKAEAYALKRKADGEYAKDTAAALATVVETMSRIKQDGRRGSFDSPLPERLLDQAKMEFPADTHFHSVETDPASETGP